MAAPPPPSLPSVTDAGGMINASPSDFRALMILVAFLVAGLCVMVIWREILSWRLAKSLDGVKDALNALNLLIVEAIARGEERQKAERRAKK